MTKMSSANDKNVFSDLQGKVVIVTGSSSGIGEAIAILFARFGAKVTIGGRDETRLEAVAAQCMRSGASAVHQVVGDIGLDEIQDRFINETLAKFGKLDVLINNAGVVYETSLDKADTYIENFDRVHRINVRAPARLTALATAHLAHTKGNIVNISSLASIKGYPTWTAYCSSKGALDQLTRCAALELAPKAIRVNSVNPGFVATSIIREVVGAGVDNDTAFAPFASWNAMKRLGRPEEIAWEVVFLASDKASYITGGIHLNCGGLHI